MEIGNSIFFTEKEAAIYLRRSKVSMWRLRVNNIISYHKFGSKILYKKEDLDAFIEQYYIAKKTS